MAKTKEEMCDVRIVTYDTSKGKVANITFHDNLSEILGEEGCRVSLVRVPKYPNRLYFRPWSKNAMKKNAVRLANGKLQYAKKDAVELCADFVGEYQLQFDDMGEKLYYVNKEKATQPGYRGGNSKIPHPNYTAGKRIAIPKQRALTIYDVPKVAKVEVKSSGDIVLETAKNSGAILELLNVLDTYDTNKAVYKAGHTLIKTIRGMLVTEDNA